MRLTGAPTFKPARCAALPHINAHTPGERRWLDCAEMEGFDNHVYLSEEAIRQAMSLLGWKTPLEVEAIEDALGSAQARIVELEAEIEPLRRLRDSLRENAIRPSKRAPAGTHQKAKAA